MVYAPIGREFSIKGELLQKGMLVAWWYNPRTGKATKIGKFMNDGSALTFTPPAPNEAEDWVLVVDSADRASRMKENFFDRPEIIYRGVHALLAGNMNYLFDD